MIIGAMRAEEARVHNSFEGFHQFTSEPKDDDLSTRDPYGSFEVFFHCPFLKMAYDMLQGGDYPESSSPGWYWVACFPGCLPDGEPMGPFATSRDALEDADEWNVEFDD